MKLVVNVPNPNNGGNMELWVKSGDVAIWQSSTKQTPFKLDGNNKAQFPVPAQSMTLWIEARSVSKTLRDIEIRLTYQNQWDTVKATAVWVGRNVNAAAKAANKGAGAAPWYTRQAANGFPDNPAVGAGNQLPSLTDANLLLLINARRAVDGSRYGIGPFGDGKGQDIYYGNRILWEFKLLPDGADKLGVVFDVTRQKSAISGFLANGTGTWSDKSYSYPWLSWPPHDNEDPNDDDFATDEQNIPVNGMLYSFDHPGSPPDPKTAFGRQRANFREWVRVKLETNRFNKAADTADGSRASEPYEWYSINYVKLGSDGFWIPDTDATSYNPPVFKGTGNGTIAVALGGNAVTEGYTASFNQGTQKWTFAGTGGGTDTQAQANGKWTLSIKGKATVVITPGTTPFATGDQFVFSVFQEVNPAGKQNAIGIGQKP